jgi:hypothetical protein
MTLLKMKSDVEDLRCRVNDLPTRDYLQQHLSIIYWELDRLERVQRSSELSIISQCNGGHIRKDLDTIGSNLPGKDDYEHNEYYWDIDRNR